MSLLPLVLTSLLAGVAPATPPADAPVDPQDWHYQRRLVAAMRNSDSPRVRALSMYTVDPDMLSGSSSDPGRGKRLREAAESAPADELVQYLWSNSGTSDDGCEPAHPCPDRAFALARVSPDNGIAWVAPLALAARSNDEAGVEAALAKVAAAERYDDFFVEGMRAWARILDGVPLTASERRANRSELPAQDFPLVQATAYAAMLPMNGATTELMRACNRERHPDASEQRRLECVRAGRLMYRTGTSNVSQRLGFALVRASGLESAEDLHARRLDDWRMHSFIELSGALERDSAEWRRYFQDLQSTGNEARAQDLLLARRGIPLEPPSDWKSSLFQ